MPIIDTLLHLFKPLRQPESEPAEAYDIWSQKYDSQPDNLMLELDRALCQEILATLSLKAGTIVDVGCGTGRHWPALLSRSPVRLAGYDVSTGMLDRLRHKYPDAEIHLISGTELTGMDDGTCDLVLSTLTIAHISELSSALAEWNRVLRPGGTMLITDYHPAALAKGGQRTFRFGERLIAVRNHVHPLPHLRSVCHRLGLIEISLIERAIDDGMRPWYARQNALSVYRRFHGIPIIYGLQLKKPDAAQ